MAVIRLDYSEIEQARTSARRAAAECREYGNELQRRVLYKLNGLPCGSSSQTDMAARLASDKMRELDEKAGSFERYAGRLDRFVNDGMSGAKQVDRRVGRMIRLKYEEFKDEHDINVNPIVEMMTYWFTDVVNRNGFLTLLKQAFTFREEALRDTREALKYWYRCQGGRELLKVAGCVVLAVMAIAGAILALPVMLGAVGALAAGMTGTAIWTAAVATASFVAATIAAADAVTAAIHNSIAYLDVRGNEPGRGKWNDNINSMSDWLRKNIFESRDWNRASMDLASGLEWTELVCDTILFFDFVHNGIRWIKNLEKGGWNNFKKNFNKKALSTFKERNPEYDRFLANPGGYQNVPPKTRVTFESIRTGLGNVKDFFQRGTENKSINYINKAVEGKGKTIHLELEKIHVDFHNWGNGFKEIADLRKTIKPVENIINFADKVSEKGFKDAVADKTLSTIPFVSNCRDYFKHFKKPEPALPRFHGGVAIEGN